jgi:hypothetical protein
MTKNCRGFVDSAKDFVEKQAALKSQVAKRKIFATRSRLPPGSFLLPEIFTTGTASADFPPFQHAPSIRPFLQILGEQLSLGAI